jgi:serine/arginine repetitive matrix protein 2
MFSVFGFGKKRKSRKVSRKGRKSRKVSKAAKPPARLLKICRHYKVKATKKVGRKRVYKSIASLKKMCLKKVRACMKKAKKAAKAKKMSFGRRKSRCGDKASMAFGRRRRSRMSSAMEFGKRRGSGRKVSKAAAMKAFRSFYKRHCSGARKSRFGNGGNPMLSNSMGYEFCPNGMGGVLGANSTGLFASPCMSAAPVAMGASSSFGRRRRKSKMSAFGRKRRSTKRRSTKRKTTKRRSTKRRSTKRRSTRIGETEFGKRRRRTVRRCPRL